MIPKPLRYRWDRYGDCTRPGPWRNATPGNIRRAMRALKMPQERICVEFDNGQRIIVRRRYVRR